MKQKREEERTREKLPLDQKDGTIEEHLHSLLYPMRFQFSFDTSPSFPSIPTSCTSIVPLHGWEVNKGPLSRWQTSEFNPWWIGSWWWITLRPNWTYNTSVSIWKSLCDWIYRCIILISIHIWHEITWWDIWLIQWPPKPCHDPEGHSTYTSTRMSDLLQSNGTMQKICTQWNQIRTPLLSAA